MVLQYDVIPDPSYLDLCLPLVVAQVKLHCLHIYPKKVKQCS